MESKRSSPQRENPMKLNTLTLIALMFTSTACTDLITRDAQPPETSLQWELGEVQTPKPSTTTTPPAEPNLPVMPPISSEGCEHPSLAPRHSAATATANAQPTLIERLDARGCVEDRHTAIYNAQGLAIERTYAFFNPELAFMTYMTLINYRERSTYNEQGLVLTRERMHLDTEEVYYSEHNTYDAQGRLLKQTRAGGHIDLPHEGGYLETFTYHASGELAQRESYHGGELVDKEVYVRDAKGAPIEHHAFVYSPRGSTLELMTKWRYDAQGRLSTVESLPVGSSSNTLTTHHYRADGTLARKTSDNYSQGWRDLYLYDEAGEERYYEQDEDGDDVPEFIRERLVDTAQNSVTLRTRYTHDGHGNYKTIKTQTEVFDEQGRLILHTEDHTGHRASRRVSTRAWDESGSTTEDRSSYDGGPLLLTSRVRYDLQERPLLRESFDPDHQQTPRSSQQQRYNRAGLLIERVQENPGSTITHNISYDAAGNKLRERTTNRADANPTQGEAHVADTIWRYQAPAAR